MIPPLDIFRIESNNRMTWKGAASDLSSAEERVRLLMHSEPGDYLIFSQRTGHKTLISASLTSAKSESKNH